uniref:Uncharacterized protein n=1 Tax=Arundo donax TaxID=35708 RepID=A0A0A9A4W7_ARUDO
MKLCQDLKRPNSCWMEVQIHRAMFCLITATCVGGSGG